MKLNARFICLIGYLVIFVLFIASCSPAAVRQEPAHNSIISTTDFKKLVVPEAGSRQLRSREYATGSQLIFAEKPKFPNLTGRAPVPRYVSIIALLEVGTNGQVYRVSFVSSNYHGFYINNFVDSIKSCVKTWRFNPLVIYENYGNAGHQQIEKSFPFSVRFQFNFRHKLNGATNFKLLD